MAGKKCVGNPLRTVCTVYLYWWQCATGLGYDGWFVSLWNRNGWINAF